MIETVHELRDMVPEKEYFVGIDSDGCVFDTMEIKHKECFCPNFILHLDMQPVSKYAREAWEFVNLYSKTRGVNRFIGLLRVIELLKKRREVKARNIMVPYMDALRKWVERETKLGNPTLEEEIKNNPQEELERAFNWSNDVNRSIETMVKNIPPYPLARESISKLTELADAIVVSQTPREALKREWREHNLADLVRAICGQEIGTKAEQLTFAAAEKYKPHHMLMIGDAPGDLKAAKANNALFYPIIPGAEESSWERLYKEAINKFFSGTYAGSFEEALIREFDGQLPEKAPWEESF
jgi:phosphoglycolate phosphatase-like HAD superfamily hydrolase